MSNVSCYKKRGENVKIKTRVTTFIKAKHNKLSDNRVGGDFGLQIIQVPKVL